MSGIRAFTMPKWGIEMSEGLLAEWKVHEGQPFTRGEILAVIETDKITNDVEAEFDGVLRRSLARVGETYPVGALLGVFAAADAPDSTIDAFVAGFRPAGGDPAQPARFEPGPPQSTPTESPPASRAKAGPAPAAEPEPVVTSLPEDLAISPRGRALAESLGVDVSGLGGSGRKGRLTYQDVDQGRRPKVARPPSAPVSITATSVTLDQHYASPLAKRLALKHGVELAALQGGGPRGRIGKDDVLAAVEARGSSLPGGSPIIDPRDEVEIVRMSPMRKAIARRLTQSKTTVPHFYLRSRVQADALGALRSTLNHEPGGACTYNDLLIRACALALGRVPELNVQVHGDEIHRFAHADISVAVATEKGLLTPIVRSAELKSAKQIGTEVRAMAERAQQGRLKPEEMEGGSFSISNLGMFGLDEFDAVINIPQGAILAVGALRREMVGDETGFRFAKVISLSLSCDHRAIDGAVGARFMTALKGLIETPTTLLGP